MADAVDRQRRHFERIVAAATVRLALAGDGGVGCRHGCAIVMPQGSAPTWMVLITFCATTSMIETSLDTPLVASRYFSSGVNAMCQTRWPTRRYLVTWWLAPSTIAIRLAGPSATKAVLPSLVMPMPTGWIASRRMPGMLKLILPVTTRLAGSITDTVPPISDDTHNSVPSRLNSAKRGRASTSTFATIWRVAVSMKWAMLVVSEVLIKILPSGLMAMPSGSTPTWISPTRARFSRSMTVTVLSFSLATYRILPAASWVNSSGSGPEGSESTTRWVATSITWMVSSSPTATRTNLPFRVNSMPRGRWPTLMVLATVQLSVSMTETVLLFSFDT